jgi:hypothetical protein
MIGFIDSFRFNTLPAGIIVPWAGTRGASAPPGWSLVTHPNNGVAGYSGCYIRGAGGIVAVGSSGIGGSPDGKVTFFTTSDGLHNSADHRVWGTSGCTGQYQIDAFNNSRRKADGDAAGNHNHRLLCTPTMGYNQYQFIKATTSKEKLPANAILLNTTHSNISWLTQIATEGKYLRAGNSTATGETSVNIIQWADEGAGILGGKHTHGWTNYQPPSIDTPGVPQKVYPKIFIIPDHPDYDGRDGYHDHAINSVTLRDKLKKVYVTAWTKATSFYGFKGMIGFWEAALPVPSGWAVCDGNNGTIDMREHFIMMGGITDSTPLGSRTGTNVISILPSSGNLLAMQRFSNRLQGTLGHTHHVGPDGESAEWVDDPDITTTNILRLEVQHERRDVDHDHPLTQGTNLSFYPQYCALYIIQKL